MTIPIPAFGGGCAYPPAQRPTSYVAHTLYFSQTEHVKQRPASVLLAPFLQKSVSCYYLMPVFHHWGGPWVPFEHQHRPALATGQ